MECFCTGMERLQGSYSVLGWNNCRGILLFWDGTTLGESFRPGMERPQGSHSVLGWNDTRGVILSGMERHQGSHSVLGWNDTRGVILSGMERHQGSHPGREGLPFPYQLFVSTLSFPLPELPTPVAYSVPTFHFHTWVLNKQQESAIQAVDRDND